MITTNRTAVKRFFAVFLISLAMIYIGRLLNLAFRFLGKDELSVIIFPVQIFSFVVGGAIIALTKWEKAEWYMVFSFTLIGVLYFALTKDYESFRITDYESLAIMSFALFIGLFISIVSNWLVRKGHIKKAG